MKNINILFELDYDDVDILSVPDEVAENIKSITQQFFNWTCDNANRHQFTMTNKHGQRILALGTNAFLWWLNTHYIKGYEKAIIVEQHTSYHPEYPISNF